MKSIITTLLSFVLLSNSAIFSQKSINVEGVYWSTENLSVTKFNNGDPIFQAKTELEWIQACKSKKPSFIEVLNTLGKKEKLYNYYVLIDKRGILPKDMRFPIGAEFLKLNDFLVKTPTNSIGFNFVLTDAYMLKSCGEISKERINDFWYLDPANIPIADVLEMDMGPSMGILLCGEENTFPLCTNGGFSQFESTGGLGGLGSGKLIRLVYTKPQ
jgi:hypothetical protein